ncbi:hypothetical protein COY90_02565 [Candidatus Roizmanbacteria bacterium CG_4_10_14_0_8_um_filter_39_9]|uniref:Uncharacterized protein n=1 Tax=Candidatus Roizmanbacteria bacterium CG_4_10_14_0_8_um_filter_39_9 TaxID=1974829 RepID=A0A2M7QCY7_9BACT|nr:MAG: hypothetical protein COY90_02565 [Candidatus Roizmanbacteria bacterium CG_4_10_14_0_8_um_filter_39_9]
MDTYLWKLFAYGFLVVNTICLLVLFELLIFKKPYISLFLILFALLVLLNKRLFSSSKKLSRGTVSGEAPRDNISIKKTILY